ncbi:hypothetical protein MD484_g7605, partial [Candolleomyces efflorescens]
MESKAKLRMHRVWCDGVKSQRPIVEYQILPPGAVPSKRPGRVPTQVTNEQEHGVAGLSPSKPAPPPLTRRPPTQHESQQDFVNHRRKRMSPDKGVTQNSQSRPSTQIQRLTQKARPSQSNPNGSIRAQRTQARAKSKQPTRSPPNPEPSPVRDNIFNSDDYGRDLFDMTASDDPAEESPQRPIHLKDQIVPTQRITQIPTQAATPVDDTRLQAVDEVRVHSLSQAARRVVTTTDREERDKKDSSERPESSLARANDNVRGTGPGRALEPHEGGTVLVESTPQTLSAHTKRVVESGHGRHLGDHEGGNVLVDSTPTQELQENDELVHLPVLTSVGLVINKRLQLYICTDCQQVVTSKSVANHLNRGENKSVPPATISRIDAISTQHQIKANLPELHKSPAPTLAIQGLKIQHRFGCPVCPFSASQSRVVDHIRVQHHGSPLKPLKDVPTQALNGKTSPNFRVIPPARTVCEQDVQAALLHEFETYTPYSDDKFTPPADSRLVSPWILRTGWHRYTQGLDVSRCRELVDLPQSHESQLSGLADVVHQYFVESSSLIGHTDPFVLQKINTSEDDRSMNHTPLHEHHQDSTVRNYSTLVTHLVAAIIRGGFEQFRLPGSDDIEAAVSLLKKDITTAHLHRLFVALWLRRWIPTEEQPFSDPTICFIALSMLQKDGSFAPAKDVTGVIAKLCNAIQLTVLREVHMRVDAHKAPDALEAFSPFEAFLVEAKPSTFQSLRFYQHFATSIAMKTVSLPRIIWPDREVGEYLRMIYLGRRVSLDDVRQIIGGVEQEICDVWEKKVLRGLKIHVPTQEPVDNLRDTTRGYSFLEDPRNEYSGYRSALTSQFLKHEDHKAQFTKPIPGTDRIGFNVPGCREWLHDLARVEGLLMLLVEMKSGAPIRASELSSTLAFNSSCRTRNLYAFGKHISIVRQYTKNTNNEQMDRIIPHALSSFEADMIVQLHTLARPFAQFICSKIYPEDEALQVLYKEMLFMDYTQPFTGATFSLLMASETAKVLGWRMTISAWRHISIAFKNAHCIQFHIEDEDVHILKTFQALQSGHSPATENRIYGLSPELVEGVSDTTINLYLQTSIEWQTMLQVVPGGLLLPYSRSTSEKFQHLVDAGALQKTVSRQSKHATTDSPEILRLLQQVISSQHQTRQVLVDEITTLKAQVVNLEKRLMTHTNSEGREKYIPAAAHVDHNDIHLTLRSFHHDPHPPTIPHVPIPTPSSLTQQIVKPLGKRVREDADDPNPAAHSKRRVVEADMLMYLRRLYGPDATWSDDGQREGVEALMKLEGDVVVILRTGVGKTAIALLPSFVEDAVTVIVIPLVSLMADWVDRLTRFGIPFEVFDPAKPHLLSGKAKIVLVSSDKAKFPSWQEAITMLDQLLVVVRYVFDEAHMYLTEQGYREEAMELPSTLRLFPMQIVLLSATIAPIAESHVHKSFALTKVHTVRGNSQRKELKYVLLRCSSSLDGKVKMFRRYLADFKESISDGEDIARSLGVGLYHAKMGAEEKKSIYDGFKSGATEGIVASSALGAGTDYPSVRVTCHFGTPFDMVSFFQQSSRGAVSVSDRDRIRGVEEMVKFVSSNECLRFQIGSFLDIQGFHCIDFAPNWEVCSSCERARPDLSTWVFTRSAMPAVLPRRTLPPLPPPIPMSRQAMKLRLQQVYEPSVEVGRKHAAEAHTAKAKAVDVYRRVLNAVKKDCGFLVIKSQISYGQGKVKYKFKPCFRCHIASWGHDTLHGPYNRDGTVLDCNNPSILRGAIYDIWTNQSTRSRFERKFGEKFVDVESFGNWLVRPDPVHSTKPMAILAWIGEEFLVKQ